MLVTLVRCKLHLARVTDADLRYVGSITIDSDLMDAAGMYPWEKVLIVDVDNGARFETYTIPGERGSGVIQLNGAAARLVAVGDQVIVMAFSQVEAPPPEGWEPRVILLNEKNEIDEVLSEGHFGEG